mgnify:CR=1 FL=1
MMRRKQSARTRFLRRIVDSQAKKLHNGLTEKRTAIAFSGGGFRHIERGVCYCLLPNPKKAVFERLGRPEKWLFKFLQQVRRKVKKIAKSVCYRVCY